MLYSFWHGFKNRTRSTGHDSGPIQLIRLETGWTGIGPTKSVESAKSTVISVNQTNQPVHSKLSGSIQFFLSIKTTLFWCFWHQNNSILEYIKPHTLNPPSPNRSCCLPPSPPPTRRDRLLPSVVSPCKISLHWPLQDHRRLSRVFLVVPLEAAKPPSTARTPVVTIPPLL